MNIKDSSDRTNMNVAVHKEMSHAHTQQEEILPDLTIIEF